MTRTFITALALVAVLTTTSALQCYDCYGTGPDHKECNQERTCHGVACMICKSPTALSPFAWISKLQLMPETTRRPVPSAFLPWKVSVSERDWGVNWFISRSEDGRGQGRMLAGARWKGKTLHVLLRFLQQTRRSQKYRWRWVFTSFTCFTSFKNLNFICKMRN